MLDFEKLKDPVWQAQVRAEREAKEAALEEKLKEQRNSVSICLDHYDELQEKERSLVRSCQSRLTSYSMITPAQDKWLTDIASRFVKAN